MKYNQRYFEVFKNWFDKRGKDLYFQNYTTKEEEEDAFGEFFLEVEDYLSGYQGPSK